ERSGSIFHVPPWMVPGWTFHQFSPSSTVIPAWRSMATVMSMCGIDGKVPPLWRTVMPCSYRGAESRSPETNWEEPEASMVSSPPAGTPEEVTVKGKELLETSTKRCRRDCDIVDME